MILTDKTANQDKQYLHKQKRTSITSTTTDGDNLCKASHLADMTLKIHQTTHSIVRSTENLPIPIPKT